MDIKFLAEQKLENFENRKSEITSTDVDNEYASKIEWLKSLVHKDKKAKKADSLTIYIEKETLNKLLTDKFNLTELRALCFDLGIDWDNFSNESKKTVITELIQSLERSHELLRLLFELPKINNSISWKDF